MTGAQRGSQKSTCKPETFGKIRSALKTFFSNGATDVSANYSFHCKIGSVSSQTGSTQSRFPGVLASNGEH
ncbi:MAG: hypothetical protein O2971_19190 [Proteobacteria bacterium]|nr:hypothetical protein [Pseudomonadota bacterium]